MACYEEDKSTGFVKKVHVFEEIMSQAGRNLFSIMQKHTKAEGRLHESKKQTSFL